jgi:hypothetical protein
MTQDEKNTIKSYEDFLTNNVQTEGERIYITMRFIRDTGEQGEIELVAKQHLLTDDDSGFSTGYLLSFVKHHIAHAVIKAAVDFLALGYMLRDFYLEEFLFGYQLANNALQESFDGYAAVLVDLADALTIEELQTQYQADNHILEKAALAGRVAYAD